MPNDSWGGAGLLGARIRFCSFEGASENVWHILVGFLSFRFFLLASKSLIGFVESLVLVCQQHVYPNSPAAKAGLTAEADYILATPDTLLHDQVRFFLFFSRCGDCRPQQLTSLF